MPFKRFLRVTVVMLEIDSIKSVPLISNDRITVMTFLFKRHRFYAFYKSSIGTPIENWFFEGTDFKPFISLEHKG